MASARNKDIIRRNYFQSKSFLRVIDRQYDNSQETRQLIEFVFNAPNTAVHEEERLSLKTLSFFINRLLATAQHDCCSELTTAKTGRLGPELVAFISSGSCGMAVVESDGLGVSSQSNFSTIHANTCVYSGKWQYEVMLITKGIMQLGWCTANCKFSPEDGVGDTDNSYAFDGNRVRKWNSKMHSSYGESWMSGDIIGVAIDCDEGKVSFTRNGHPLGDAFSDVSIGPGFAYFPAVSVSINEHVRINFGGTPLRYPLAGYQSLQDPPTADMTSAKLLISFVDRLILLLNQSSSTNSSVQIRKSQAADFFVRVGLPAGSRSGNAKTNAYVVEDCILPLLLEKCSGQSYINQMLDLIWTFSQEYEMKLFLEHLTFSILCWYRFSPSNADFQLQKTHLLMLQSILNHRRTRHHLLQNVLFDRVKLAYFMFIEQPDDCLLRQWISEVWWLPKPEESESFNKEMGLSDVSLSEEDRQRQLQFFLKIRDLRQKVQAVENLQINILITLLGATDVADEDDVSSQSIFLRKFRQFLKEHFLPSHIRIHQIDQCPMVVLCYFFSRLLRAIQLCHNNAHKDVQCISSGCPDLTVPFKQFSSGTVDYWDAPRLGGRSSYLQKVHKADIESCSTQSESSLSELFDGIVILYNMAAHKQLAKICSAREAYHECIGALRKTELRLVCCPIEEGIIRSELENSRRVFTEKVTAQSRIMAWVRATMFAEEGIADLKWLFRCLLKTLRSAYENSGPLFSFVPEFYVETCINIYNALTTYFSPSLLNDSSGESKELFTDYANFVCTCCCDSRIIIADIRETLIQALGCLVCYPVSVRALENTPLESRLALTRMLLAVYENRPWAQTNWIVVKLWKGCGFAYRYTQLPHMDSTKNKALDIGSAGLQKPCPSLVFQEHISEVLENDGEGATKLVDSMINQLNWSFSEFVRMLQEIEQLVVRPTGQQHSFIDERQLKICATCFDISVGLLRALEMIITLKPQLLIDWSASCHSELLLRRLLQILTHILIRVTGRLNTFDKVCALRLPGLESVDHFPILVAVMGILVKLVFNTEKTSQQRILAALISEPGFQLSALEFLIGDDGSTCSVGAVKDDKKFSLTNFEEVSADESQQVEHLLSLIRSQIEHTCTQEIAEDMLCNICYAQVKSVVFKPCRHRSCRACITHQMMSRNECFFCKSKVLEIVDISNSFVDMADTF